MYGSGVGIGGENILILHKNSLLDQHLVRGECCVVDHGLAAHLVVD